MKYNYHILTDASADLVESFAIQEDIQIIQMDYSIGDEQSTYACIEAGSDLKEFYESQRHGKLTSTSQISPQTYVDTFTPYAKKGEAVLYVSLSSGLSNTYQSSLMGAQEIREQYPQAKIVCVDSLSATVGMGMLLEMAAKNRAGGMSIDDNAAWLEANRLRVQHWFMVDDLMFLKHGGRISPTTAVVGSALNIKPILRIEADGTLSSFAKKRGAKSAMNQLVEFFDKNSDHGPGERVMIVHADSPESAEYLEAEVKKINPGAIITKNLLSPIIGCHVGPGMCAIVHFGKPESSR